jgi:hypothetical protein
MDGASLPVLAAAQTLTTKGAAAVAPAAATDFRDSFAAILGATDLTGLTADQQVALTQLLADPAGTLRPLTGAVGKELPEAAIRGLLGALGIALDPQTFATKAATPATGGTAETQPANVPDDGADPAATLIGMLLAAKAPSDRQALGANAPMSALTEEAEAPPAEVRADGADLAATLLAIVLQGSAGTDGSAPRPEPIAADSGSGESSDAMVIEVALPRGAILAATGSATPVAQTPADEERPAGLDAFWVMIRHAGSSLGVADAAQPRAAPASGGSATPQSESGGFSLPTTFLAAVESVAEAVGAEAPPIAELTRGLATALDAVSSGAGRLGLAAAPDIVPPRMAAAVSEAVSVPVGERGWERAFGERVVWLVGQQIQSAEVRLNPPHLGPVEVRLSLTGQDANISFTVAHGATRDAIEQAIPRLRELFAEHQLQILNVDVGQRDASSQASQGDRRGQGSSPSAGVGSSTSATGAESVASVQRGGLPSLVDEYV